MALWREASPSIINNKSTRIVIGDAIGGLYSNFPGEARAASWRLSGEEYQKRMAHAINQKRGTKIDENKYREQPLLAASCKATRDGLCESMHAANKSP